MHYLRWLLTYFVGMASLPLPPFLGIMLGTIIGTRLCPRGQLVSDMCMAPWFVWVNLAIECFGFGLGAALVVALPALVAPSEKATVAGFMFWTGTVLAVVLTLMAGVGMIIPSAVAMVTGWWVRRLWLPKAGA